MVHNNGNGIIQRFVFVKYVTAILIVTLLVNFVGYPLMAQTIEADAGKKYKDAPYIDEFSKKAQERREESPTMQRDPRLACLLSLIVPGGGHVYLRNDLKAAGFCLLTATAYSVSAYYLYVALMKTDSSTERKSRLILSGLLFVVGALIHVVGIVEAYNDAIEINEKQFYFGTEKSVSPYVAKN
ncbi:MAG: hypothetical protein N3F66_07780 [Spirochaetes bacterium]|nr:hypothetical protein [Spirochaetota bacterium]